MESQATRMRFFPKVLMDVDIIAAPRNLVLRDAIARGVFQNVQERLQFAGKRAGERNPGTGSRMHEL